MNQTWKRNVPVYDYPIITRPLLAMLALGAVGCVLILYREVVGLGLTSGMNDAYAWGIWKTLNTMVLTGLGSGGFAIGIAGWIFHRQRMHAVMRTAVLTSFLVYASGLTMLGIDVGRPWNFYWILMPWHWNGHSPLLEVAFCMPLYTMLPLTVELIPPVMEWIHGRWPQWRPQIALVEGILRRVFPFILGLAFVLPAMHQSSLGALMLLGGNRVHPLWQTPFLPLLYVWAAAYMGVAFVTCVLLASKLVWKRPIDMEVLSEMNRLTIWLIGTWTAFRLVDLAFDTTLPALLFWMETLLLLAAMAVLVVAGRLQSQRRLLVGSILAALGGMLYRFNPTTLAFQPKSGAFYFPSAMEMMIDLGILSLTLAAFCVAVKLMAFLPASTEHWHAMEAEQNKNASTANLATADSSPWSLESLDRWIRYHPGRSTSRIGDVGTHEAPETGL
jgi:Ni/Fe-hydrogenase subunit HybB-like protein